MIRALEVTGLDDMMAGGPTRAALMRRGLVSKRGGTGRFGHFTRDGRRLAAEIQGEKGCGHWSDQAAEAEQELDTIGEEEVETENGWRNYLAEVPDLDMAMRALVREKAIRDTMAKTGEGRETVVDMVEAMESMDREAVLDLAEGEPTTLIDALTRYVRILETWDEVVPRDRVAGDLDAILEYPWSGEEERVQLHHPGYGLDLNIIEGENRDLEIRMGGSRFLIHTLNWEELGTSGQQAAEEAVHAVYRATLARVIADRDHHVQLSGPELYQLRQFLDRPNGSATAGGRLTVDACGAGVIIRTRPYTWGSVAEVGAERRRLANPS